MAVHPPLPATSVPSVLAERLPDGSVRCGVCAHRCLVRPGRHGICGVRENVDGVLVCHAYGAVAALGLDPIEKKPLFHVDPGSLSYSIATLGCPFHCRFCQNWEIAQGPRLGLRVPTRLLRPDQVVAAAKRAGARSVAYTYVEPTVFLEYALDTAGLAARPASGTSSSPTATPPPRRSTSWRRSSTPRTSISRRSTTGSTGSCAAPGWRPSSRPSWRCGRRAPGSS
jgi:hypothetical protein